MKETPLSKVLVSAVKGLPRYLVTYIGGLVVALMTQLDLTTILFFGIVVGFIGGPLVGLAAFLGMYILMRFFGRLGDGIFTLAQALNTHSQTQVTLEQHRQASAPRE